MCTTTIALSESEEPSEPIREYEHHIFNPLQIFIDHQGYFSLDVYFKVYGEPQEGNDDGFNAGAGIDWDEPLYYKGSTKGIWLLFNGFGIIIIMDGPDLGLNTDIYIIFKTRHISFVLEIHTNSGIVPV